MTGSGKAVVLSVGKHTLIEKEKIDQEFKSNEDLTPL
jgi:hypothetical protein